MSQENVEIVRRVYEAASRGDSGAVHDFEELSDAPGECLVSVVERQARGRASGAEVELRLALVWTIRDGRVVRVEWFPSEGDALRAAGLSG